MPGERRCFSSEIDEYHLRHVLREVVVAGQLAQGGRVDEIQVPPHQFGERHLGAFDGVLGKESGVIHWMLVTPIRSPKRKPHNSASVIPSRRAAKRAVLEFSSEFEDGGDYLMMMSDS